MTAGQAAQKFMRAGSGARPNVTAGQAAQKVEVPIPRELLRRDCRTGSSEIDPLALHEGAAS